MREDNILTGKGCIVSPSIFYFDVSFLENELEERDHTAILINEEDDWNFWELDKKIIDYISWEVDGKRFFQGITNDGFANTDIEGAVWKNIDENLGGPNHLKHLTALCMIEGFIYAVGMSRICYRKKTSSNKWKRFDNGLRLDNSSLEITGLTDILGVSGSELYSIGYDGEIWWFDSGVWKSIVTPTNLLLNSLCQSDDGSIYICGNEGVILRGRYDQWDFIDNNVTDDDLYSICSHDGVVYVVAEKSPIYFIDEGQLEEISTFPKEISTGYLESKYGKLLSVGEKDIFVFEKGKWNEIVIPPA